MRTTLELRPNGQTAWQPLPLPFPSTISGPAASVGYVNLVVDDEAPANLFLSRDTALYHSLDGGHTWEQLPDFSGNALQVTPYLPLTVLDVHADGHVFALSVPDAGQQLRAPAAVSGAPGAQFFPLTGHNLGGPFLAFWQSHGGLAQIGYPLTEPIRQVSPVDGRIYAMQYFERAVLEWHPENAAPYDILGSLIGAFSYRARYGLAGAPGQHASTDHPRFFPETVHTVGGAFRTYWESHGGLAQQGYPISEEFTEMSALDGKPYTVQYFQRAVFEWHPENAGTPYAVLLSQLGRGQLDGDIPTLPVCARGPGAPFSTFWGANPAASARLGCPIGPPQDTATAVEPFEHGRLVWLATGPFPGQPGPTVLVLTDDGRYQYVADTYVSGGPDACSASPPAGRYVPQHGFNQVWCTTPGVRDALGWALAPESGGPGHTQAFATGWMLQVPGAGILALGAPAAGTPRGLVQHVWVAPGP